ncbi:MAG: hypothetical protein K2G05_05140, partial [Duncaniella sp.]|nr:hypothetical protein [Duncaniella sp.]
VELHTVYLNNMTTTGDKGLINITGESAFDGSYGISFSDCSIPEGSAQVYVAAPLKLASITGDAFSAYVTADGYILPETTYGGGIVTLYFDPTNLPATVVKNSNNLEGFVCGVEGCELVVKEEGDNADIVARAIVYAAQINGVKYKTLAEAWAAAVDGDVIELLNDATFGSLNVQAGTAIAPVYRNLTLKSATDTPVTLTREDWSTITLPYKGNSLVIENVIFDGNNESTNNALLEVNSGSELTLKNVTFRNVVKTHTAANNNKGIVSCNNGSTTVSVINVENVAFSDCTPDAYGEIYSDGTSSVKGDCEFSLYLDNTSVANDGLTAGKVTLLFPTAGADKALVTGNTSTEFIVSGVPGYGFVANDTDNTIGVEKMLVHLVSYNYGGEVIDDNYYATFEDATNYLDYTWSTSSMTIDLLGDVTIDEYTYQPSNKVTIKSVGNTAYKITRTNGKRAMFASNYSSDNLIFENVIIDGANLDSDTPMFTCNQGTLEFNNVQIVNGATNSTLGLISATTTATRWGDLNLYGVTFTGCTVPNGAYVNCGIDCNVKGECNYSININKFENNGQRLKLTDAGVTGGKLKVSFDPAQLPEDNIIVYGATSTEYFESGTDGYLLVVNDGNLVAQEKP